MYNSLVERSKKSFILKDLAKKMVFLTGPRQVGKTWLAKDIAKHFKKPLYLNHDNFDHRDIIIKQSWHESTDLLVFDEIHKMPEWKNYLKGVFDTKPDSLSILVTGSARLETFKFSGDSLAGRYFSHRLMPFSLAEISSPTSAQQETLITQGGFPEPFLAASEDDANKWRLQYIQGLIRFDILDFEKIHDLKSLQLILEILRRNVGSPISYKAIAEDVHLSQQTVKKYIEIFEELFIVFRVTPLTKNIARSLLKEPKIYFYDTGMVIGDEGKKFENFVAVSLLSHLYSVQDTKGIPTELKYLKTKEGKEVDFCLVQNGEVDHILEAKLSDKNLSPNLHYFCDKYDFKGVQLVKNLKIEARIKNTELRRSFDYLSGLKM